VGWNICASCFLLHPVEDSTDFVAGFCRRGFGDPLNRLVQRFQDVGIKRGMAVALAAGTSTSRYTIVSTYFCQFFGILGLLLALPLMIVTQIVLKEVLVKDISDRSQESPGGKSVESMHSSLL
jgi:predicted PurR-regulated permease PerM